MAINQPAELLGDVESDLLPMEQGIWVEGNGAGAPPVFCRHKSHILRLTVQEGRRVVADPRAPLLQAAPVQQTSDELDAMRARIRELEAQLAAKAEQDFGLSAAVGNKGKRG